MTGSLIARASAILLTAGGVALLFASEEIVAVGEKAGLGPGVEVSVGMVP